MIFVDFRHGYAVLPHGWATLPYAGRCTQPNWDVIYMIRYDVIHDTFYSDTWCRVLRGWFRTTVRRTGGNNVWLWLLIAQQTECLDEKQLKPRQNSQIQLHLGGYRAWTGTTCLRPHVSFFYFIVLVGCNCISVNIDEVYLFWVIRSSSFLETIFYSGYWNGP